MQARYYAIFVCGLTTVAIANPDAAYTKQVVNRAHLSFSALQAMNSWVSTTSATETQYTYEYIPNFCSEFFF